MYVCESLTIQKAECQRIDAFKLWCLRRLLRAPWIANRTNQSILMKINLEYSLVGLCWSSNTLVTWCDGSTHWKRPSCWERLKAKEKGVAEDEVIRQHHRLNGHEFEQTLGESEGWRAWPAAAHRVQRVRHDFMTEQQQHSLYQLWKNRGSKLFSNAIFLQVYFCLHCT